MKKVLFILLALLLSFISCSEDESENDSIFKSASKEEVSNWIIGKWIPSPTNELITYFEVKQGGKFYRKTSYSSKINEYDYQIIELSKKEEKTILIQRKEELIKLLNDYPTSEGEEKNEYYKKQIIELFDKKISNLNDQNINSLYIKAVSTGHYWYYKIGMASPDLLILCELEDSDPIRLIRSI